MHDDPRALMLFTAGFGTRMRPLTDNVPKPLIEVAGRPLLDHALDVARGAGVGKIVANTHYLADIMQSALRDRTVDWLHEDKILETGGGLRNALPALGPGPVVTLNSDSVWTGPNPLTGLLAAWDAARMDALLMLVPHGRAAGHTGAGDFDLAVNGALRRGSEMVYTGLQIIDPSVLDRIGDRVFSLNLAWDLIAREGRLFGHVHQGGWCDVGQPESIALAEEMLENAHVRD